MVHVLPIPISKVYEQNVCTPTPQLSHMHIPPRYCGEESGYSLGQLFFDCRGSNNQRTNGPVNAHLRSAVYTNVIENSPSIGQMKPLGHFFFSE